MDWIESLISIVQQANLKARGNSITHRKTQDLISPASVWVNKTRIGNTVGTAISIVLATLGCTHARDSTGGCTMCSYLLDGVGRKVSSESLIKQFKTAFNKVKNVPDALSVKIYTSGSFFDPDEVPPEARIEILSQIAKDDRVQQVVIESRPEFVTDSILTEIDELLSGIPVELGIGLETSSDWVRKLCINKGFSFTVFSDALKLAQSYGIGIRAYVLLKPPFLSERDALNDASRTIVDVAHLGATTISLNPVNIQRRTLVEQLWLDGYYRPPWLWSIIAVLEKCRKAISKKVVLLSEPVAAGKIRGPHNCGSCDSRVATAIRNFSLSQETTAFEVLDCDCKSLWYHSLIHEDFATVTHDVRI